MTQYEMMKRLAELQGIGSGEIVRSDEYKRRFEQECVNNPEFRLAWQSSEHEQSMQAIGAFDPYEATLNWSTEDGLETRRSKANSPKWTYVIIETFKTCPALVIEIGNVPAAGHFRAIRHFRAGLYLAYGLEHLVDTAFGEALESRKSLGFLWEDFDTLEKAKACIDKWHIERYSDLDGQWEQWTGQEPFKD